MPRSDVRRLAAATPARGLLLLAALSCQKAPEAASAAVPVELATVARHAIVEALSAEGPLQPLPGDDVKLGALISGRLAEVLVAEGDRVTKGQVLARIEATPFKDALAQAQAQVTQAKAQRDNDARKLERARKLVAAGIAARQEVDDAAAQASASAAVEKAAEAALSTARNQLDRTELRAPFDGLAAHVFAAAGEPTDGSGKPIIEIARTERLELHATLPAVEASRLQPGQSAQVSLSGGERRWRGEVVAVSPLLDASTGTASARIRVDNADGFLKGGEMARAQIVLATHADALTIPEAALVPIAQSGGNADSRATASGQDTLAVETVDKDERAQRRSVQVGLRAAGRVEILGGLHEGDQVIVQGAYALPDGARVKPAARPPTSGSGESSP